MDTPLSTNEELKNAVAYLVLNDISKGAYWPLGVREWATERMRGEKRVGIQILYDALPEVDMNGGEGT